MASVRNIVAYRELSPTFATFTFDSEITYSSSAANGSTAVGLAVKINGNGQVTLTTDASAVDGRLVRVHDDTFCTVQIGGTCLLPKGNAITLTAGSKIVGALGASSAKGYIRNVAVATLAEVAVAGGSKVLDAQTSAKPLINGSLVTGAYVLVT